VAGAPMGLSRRGVGSAEEDGESWVGCSGPVGEIADASWLWCSAVRRVLVMMPWVAAPVQVGLPHQTLRLIHHPDISLAQIVIERDGKLGGEPQYAVGVVVEAQQQVVGLGSSALAARRDRRVGTVTGGDTRVILGPDLGELDASDVDS